MVGACVTGACVVGGCVVGAVVVGCGTTSNLSMAVSGLVSPALLYPSILNRYVPAGSLPMLLLFPVTKESNTTAFDESLTTVSPYLAAFAEVVHSIMMSSLVLYLGREEYDVKLPGLAAGAVVVGAVTVNLLSSVNWLVAPALL